MNKEEMEKNGWTIYVPTRGDSGKYKKYENQIVVIVPDEKGRDHLYITEAVFTKLGRPKLITVMTRGANWCLVSGDDSGVGFKVGSNHRGWTRYISTTRLRREFNLRPGIYNAHVESGSMIVFDTAQIPSVP